VGWIVGIDEAGYGPNLGPFVMTAVACRVPEAAGRDLWKLLRGAVRRAGQPEDDRLLVADSKIVYARPRGLRALERGVLAVPWEGAAGTPPSLAELVDRVCAADRDDLQAEAWYRGTHALPVDVAAEELSGDAQRLLRACADTGVGCWQLHAAVVCPPRFNAVTAEAGSKGAVLAQTLGQLLRCSRQGLPGGEPLTFIVDKHGGRNRYAPFIQDALAEGAVVARQEGMSRSTYEVLGLDRQVHLTFQPRAEGACLCVALASMASKYLREVLMREFNRFWQEQVPGLKATAGYPGDAARFFEEIRPAARRLSIAETALWRSR
jgi:hypothetical protein